MTPERIQELAALSATGSLECPDAAVWARLLEEGNALAWKELAANRQALATMTLAECPPRQPPAALKERILSRARAVGASAPAPRAETPAFRNVRKDEGPWLPIPIRGLRVKLLSRDPARNFALIYAEIDAGVGYPSHHHSSSKEIYVMSGDLRVNGVTLQAGDFHHADGDTHHTETVSIHGCTALLLVPADSLVS